MLSNVVGDRRVGLPKRLLQLCRKATRGAGHGGKVGTAGELARQRAAGMAPHAVGEGQRQLRRAAGRAVANRNLLAGTSADYRCIFLVAAGALARATGIVERHCYSFSSVSSDQSNSSPQNGTKASCVRPIVITSMASRGTAAVGFLLLIETILVLAKLGTNRKQRSTES